MNIELYICVENLALTSLQKNNLVDAIFLLGKGYMYPSPVRKDNQAGIYEAKFRSDDILQFGWKTKLGALFSIDPLTINMLETPASYGGGVSVELVFSRAGIDYFRVILFGAASSSVLPKTKELSAAECLGYLSVNRGAWF